MVDEQLPAEFDIRKVGQAAYSRWCLAFWAMSALATCGLVLTLPHPEAHPWAFALSVTWLLGILAGALTRNALLNVDPKRFGPFRWEHDGRIYEYLGITAFAWLLQRTPLGWLDPFLKLRSGRGDMGRLLRELGFAEGSHLAQGVATVVIALALLAFGQPGVALALVVLAVPLHVYPIMLQRRNRGRVLRVAARCARRRPTRG